MMPLLLHEILVLQVVLTTITVLFCWTVSSSSKGKVVCKIHGVDDDDDACWLSPPSRRPPSTKMQPFSVFTTSSHATCVGQIRRYGGENGRK